MKTITPGEEEYSALVSKMQAASIEVFSSAAFTGWLA